MSILKEVDAKMKKKAGEEYIPGEMEVDEKKIDKIMALFN